MPGSIVHVGASGMCPHGGQIQVIATNKVLLSAQPAATVADQYVVALCPFQVPAPSGTKPQPCVKVQWTVPATRVFVMGQPVITQASTGVCLSVEQIPQGPPTMVTVQPRVTAL